MTQGKGRLPAELPFLPLYNQVLLPGAFARVHFKRSGPVSGPLLEHLLAQQGEQVLVAALPVLESDTAKQAELREESDDGGSVQYKEVATAARVLQVSRNTQTGAWVVTLEGWCRIYTDDAPRTGPNKFLLVGVEQAGVTQNSRLQDGATDKEAQDLATALHAGTKQLASLLNQSVGSPATVRMAELLQKLSPAAAADVLASMLTRDTAFKQLVLEAVEPNERMRLVVGLLHQTVDNLEGGSRKVSEEDSGKQLAIRPPLHLLPSMAERAARAGVKDPEEEDEEELSVLMNRLRSAKPPAEVLKVANREYRRLKKSNEHHPGYAMSRAYLETLADLPWNTFSGQAASDKSDPSKEGKVASSDPASDADSAASKEQIASSATPAQATAEIPAVPAQAVQMSLAEARRLLDKDHYGLDKVKDRIVQYLAVRRLKGPDARAPILCFVGPPGTGKTSLASSISKVLLRPFQRVSVGGVRDEAEIRGHRRTYVGAMPGRIIQALRRSGVRDPVLLLDEVDKMGHDSLRGDPASALLEVLDPNQNQAFVDTYLSVPFDLSQVVFVATANQLQNMSGPLLDRLEIIQLSGYTLEEKRHIAQRHLIPGLLAEHGLNPQQLHFPDVAITLIADGYTREAGVRSLSRSLAAICRHVAVQIVSEQDSQEPSTFQPSDSTTYGQPEALAAHQQHAAQLSIGHSVQAQHPQHSLHVSDNAESARGNAESPSDAAEQALQLPAAVFPSSFFLTGLWDGLKGALKPHKHPSRRRPHTHLDSEHSLHQGVAHGQYTQFRNSHQAPRQAPTSAQCLPDGPKHHSAASLLAEAQGTVSNPYEGSNDDDMDSLAVHQMPSLTVTAKLIEEVLGPRRHNETDTADSLTSPGSAAGLVWTAVGGQVQYVECCCTSPGQSQRPGKLVLTGQAGEVLQESAHLALSWIRSHTHQLAAAAAAAVPASSSPSSAATAPAATGQAATAPAARRATAGSASHDEAYCSSLRQSDSNGSDQKDDTHASCASGNACQVCCISQQSPDEQSQACRAHQAAQQSVSDSGSVCCSAGVLEQHDQHRRCSARSMDSVQPSSALSVPAAARNMHDEAATSQSAAHNSVRQRDVTTAAAQWDLHVHLPAGAVSKDGPSAGITLAIAMVSLFLGRCARADTAMTGELTLRGLVLPIGGLKEKLLAAHHAGIQRVLVPKRNWRDVQADVPSNIKSSIEIIPVHVLEDVLQHAFDPPLLLTSVAKL